MCAESSADMASSGSVSNGFTLGFFRIHSERFLTDRGVPCFKSQKVNLHYWAKRQKITTDPSSPMHDHVKSERKRRTTTRKTHAVSLSINRTRCQ